MVLVLALQVFEIPKTVRINIISIHPLPENEILCFSAGDGKKDKKEGEAMETAPK